VFCKIRKLNWRFSLIKLVLHKLCEGNACADYLAKLGAQNLVPYAPLSIPPAGMNLLLLGDASGTLFSK
jgi:hypothetical protein